MLYNFFMIRIYPDIDFEPVCPRCNIVNQGNNLIWEGIHVTVSFSCNNCHDEYIQDLPIGHASKYPCTLDLNTNEIFGQKNVMNWFGKPFLRAINHPQEQKINFVVKKRENIKNKKIILLNCIDYLYGHTLLKLFNVQEIHDKYPARPLVVIVPSFLEWLVPNWVSEVWVVDIKLDQSQRYFLDLEDKIKCEFKRFSEVFICNDRPSPKPVNIEKFTNTVPFDFDNKDFRITYIWREDRAWFFSFHLAYIAKKLHLLKILIFLQKLKVQLLFRKIRGYYSQAKFTVAGLGKSYSFPRWIDDKRVSHFSPQIETDLCELYAESKLVIGVHGSSMLLPSAHAGLMLNLVPSDRYGNLSQDTVLIKKKYSPRYLNLKNVYLPTKASVRAVASFADRMIYNADRFYKVKENSL